MKLLYVATSDRFWPFLTGQAAYMKERGFDLHAASSPGPLLDAFAASQGAQAWPVPMRRGFSPLADLLALWRLWRVIRRIKPDVVHAHTPKAGLLSALAARAAPAPVVVYTLHGLIWQTRKVWRRWLLICLDRLACHLAHQTLSVSESIRRQAIAFGLAPPGRILVPANGSANGIDFERFDRSRFDVQGLGKLRRQYGLPDQALVMGFVGRLVPDKGIPALQSAWTRLRDRFPQLHLLLAGDTEEHDPLPTALLTKLRLDPRVHFTEWQTNMPEHYCLMDLLVLPSRREGMPYAVLEAAAMGLPSAAFACDGVVDAVDHGVTGLLVSPGDAEALAAACARLLTDADLRLRLGRQARERAHRLYPQKPLWRNVYQVYCAALEAKRCTSRLWSKRPADFAGAVAALVLLAPLLGLIALAVWINLGRPILYRQLRPGLGERLFPILKFRTMLEGDGPDSERLTRFGKWLRRTSLDELPQLFNVIRGDMSFIGPRPLLERYLPYYTPRERLRHTVRPGLTGWAQVHGRNDLTWRQRLEMDVWYVEHASFLLDLRIAAVSVWNVVACRGAREDPRSLMLDLDVERLGI
jgi:lipopolysaccharide/colanic/teichoic acid biosynthesis glycosyltransferase